MGTQLEPKRMGRPPMPFSQAVADFILEEIASSTKGIMAICREQKAQDKSFPSHETIYKWLNLYDNFAENYARAKAKQMELLAEEIIAIADAPAADNVAVQQAKLKADTRKWVMSKLAPKRFGDRIDVTSGGEKLPANAQHIDARVQSIVMQAAQRMAKGQKLEGWDALSPEAQTLLE